MGAAIREGITATLAQVVEPSSRAREVVVRSWVAL